MILQVRTARLGDAIALLRCEAQVATGEVA